MFTARRCTNCHQTYEYYQKLNIVPDCPRCGYNAIGQSPYPPGLEPPRRDEE